MKKWLIAGLVVLLIVGGVIGFIVANGGSGNGTLPTPTPSSTAIGTIQVPNGPKIKVVFEKPPELKASWEKVGMEGFQLQIVGSLTNVAGQAVKFSEIAFLLDGRQVAYLPGRTLQAGEAMPIARGIVGYDENTKVLEIKILDFQVVGGTPVPTATPTPTPGQTMVFAKAPDNPKTPAETVAAVIFLCDKGDYSKASGYFTEEVLNEIGSLENSWKTGSNGRRVEKLEIIEVEMYNNGGSADVNSTIRFSNGTSFTGPTHLIFEGKWKIG